MRVVRVFRVWCPGRGETEERDGLEIRNEDSAEDAALRWAEEDDRDSVE